MGQARKEEPKGDGAQNSRKDSGVGKGNNGEGVSVEGDVKVWNRMFVQSTVGIRGKIINTKDCEKHIEIQYFISFIK